MPTALHAYLHGPPCTWAVDATVGPTPPPRCCHPLCGSLNSHNADGMTALGLACWEGWLACARALLDARADADGKDSTGSVFYTPLMLACDSGSSACVELLLNHRAGPYYMLSRQYAGKGEPKTAMEFALDGCFAQEEDSDGGKKCEALLKEHMEVLEVGKTAHPWASRGTSLLEKANEFQLVDITKKDQIVRLYQAIFNVRPAHSDPHGLLGSPP